MAHRHNAIPEPLPDLESLRLSIQAAKEIVEVLTRQRKPIESAAVTWQDLVDLELIAPDQVPSR